MGRYFLVAVLVGVVVFIILLALAVSL